MTERARRPGPTVRTRVREVTPTGERHHEDRLATEEPLEIRLSWPGHPAERIWVTMRTPGHDFELATGFLFHEGVIGRDAIHSVAYCTDADLLPEQEFNVVTVGLDGPPLSEPSQRHTALSAGSSACGVCGTDSVTTALSTVHTARWSGDRIPLDVLRGLPEALRTGQRVFDVTGGLHGAGLFTSTGDALVIREDVGRHNAVDKVTGARVLAGRSPAEAVLVVSGRIGFELAQKAAAAGVGTIAAVGAPSSLAVRLGRDTGLSIVGFVSSDRCVVYT